MSTIKVDTIQTAAGTGSLTVPAETGTVVVKDGSNDVTLNDITAGGIYLGGTGAANYLDDYETGTFTPGISFGGSSSGVTYAANEGAYIKVGKMVYCWGILSLTNNGTGSGSAKITGFPFTVGGSVPSTGIEGGGMLHYWANSSSSVSAYSLTGEEGAASGEIFAFPASGTSATNANESYIGNSFDCRFFVTYPST